MKISVVGRSISKPIDPDSTLNSLFEPEEIRKDLTIMSGKASGICYMPDDYLSDGIQNEEKAIKRAAGNANSGHYSVYEHGHVNFIIEADKMMAMVLNSLGLYATSEKSSRYTAMHPDTKLECEKYEKWQNIFKELINVYYKDTYDEKQISKLAMENARYMISVFVPTTMEYTVPFSRAILTCSWLDILADNVDKAIEYKFQNITANLAFYKRLAHECRELAALMREQIGITKDDHILDDHKRIGIELFDILSAAYKLETITNIYQDPSVLQAMDEGNPLKPTYYGDSYVSNYQESLAGFAQSQRHRTLHYSIILPKKLDCYVPKIIRSSMYEVEWRKDYNQLVTHGVMPQCTLLNVCEQGRFEDFVLKCKERLCSRAQLEIMEVTRDQVAQFAKNRINLGIINIKMLNDMIEVKPGENPNSYTNVIVKPKCRYSCYKCKEACKLNDKMVNYFRNI